MSQPPGSAAAPVRLKPARRITRLASAVHLLEQRRDRLTELQTKVRGLSHIDMIVVDGEREVLAELDAELRKARKAVGALAKDADDAASLRDLEALVDPGTWSVLDEVAALLEEKARLADQARAEVQRRLRKWEAVAARVGRAVEEIQARRLTVVEPQDLAISRDRLNALWRQASNGYKESQLLDAWRALDNLEATTPAQGSNGFVPPDKVPERLEALMKQASEASGRMQLTVLRGPLDDDRFEYTLMLLTPTSDGHVGVNIQDSTTIVMADRAYFLGEAEAATNGSYRALRAARRDGRPPPEVSPGRSGAADTMRILRDMGTVLYRLLVPERMKQEMRRHPSAPITVITNDLELPWELMHDDDFLALSRGIARMPVGRSRARATPSVERTRLPRRVALIASAGPDNELPGSIREVELIAAGLKKHWADQVNVDVFMTGTERRPTGRRFRQVLMSGDYDIIHYAGHAVFDTRHQDQSGLVLERGEVCFAQKIQRLLEGSPLVFLNACESARLRDDSDRDPPEGSYERDPKEGLASAFVYGGALACIGTMWPVTDTEAADFAVAFYGHVLEGQPLGEAMRRARTMTAENHADDPSWASFVLYGDPTYSLGIPSRLAAVVSTT
jgi:hypothetical protein